MNTDIYSMWYKQPSILTSTPNVSIMIRLEGIESYGLYMQFADTLHTIGGYQEYNFKKICLMLGYTKKNIKEKLNRVLNNYNLFDFCIDEFGVEMIGLERIKKDIESLSKHKINGAKGGKKRAENYLKRKQNEICNDEIYSINKSSEITKINVRTLQRRAKYLKAKKINGVYFLTGNQINNILLSQEKPSLEELNKINDFDFVKTYLIKNKRNGYYKIGKSKNPIKREKTLQSEEPLIQVVKIFDKNIESILHKDYKDFRIRGEWFNLSKIQIKYICEHY